MHATVLQQDLNKGLGITGRVVASRGQMPILANILIEATKDGITLAATNLEIGLRVEVEKSNGTGVDNYSGEELGRTSGISFRESLDLQTEGEKLKIKSESQRGVGGDCGERIPANAESGTGEKERK